MDLELDNLQWLIYLKSQLTPQKRNVRLQTKTAITGSTKLQPSKKHIIIAGSNGNEMFSVFLLLDFSN